MSFLQSSHKWKDYFLKQIRKKHSIQKGGGLDPNTEMLHSSASTGLVKTFSSSPSAANAVRKNKTRAKAKKPIKSKTNGKRRGRRAAKSKKNNTTKNINSRRKKKRAPNNKSVKTIF